MQTVANFPTELDVAEPSFSVSVAGVSVDAESVTVSREIPTPLPAQVTNASGITAATGSVSWALGDEVTTHAAHPWGNRPVAKPADGVVIDAGYGSTLARQLTGIVDSSSGSDMGDASSDVVDPTDKLNRPVTFEPHMSVMPPWSEGGPFIPCNNAPTFTTDRILRACGFNATPPADPAAILSAPLMGSAWPEIGRLDSASQVGFPTFPPSFSQTHWGVAANSIDASYTPIMSGSGTNRIDDKNLQITLKTRYTVPGGGVNVFDVAVWWGTSRIRLRVGPNREIQAIVGDSTGAAFVATMAASAAATADTFTLMVTPGGTYTIYANNGANVVATRTLGNELKTTNITRVQIVGTHLSSAHVGGVQVAFYSRPTWEAKTTAILTPSASNLGLPAVPGIRGRNALDLLKEQAEAECAAMWIDEYGVFRWVNRNILTSTTPAATLTALDDVLSIGWDSDAKGVRSGVDIKSRSAKITRFAVSSVTLYRGSGESLQSNTSTTDIAEPSADESWFSVDTNAAGWTRQQLDRGEMSMVGGIVSKDNTADVWALDVGKLTYSLTPLSSESLAITHTAGNLGTGETVVLKTAENDNFLKPFRRDKPLPIIRGKARVRWSDLVTTGASAGPATSSKLEHDVGFWVQDPDALQSLADWLSSQVSAPRAVLQSLAVVPDPRRQLTDIVWVTDPENLGIKLRVLITYLSLTVSEGSMEQTIGGAVLEVQSTTGVTNAQFDAARSTRTNKSLDTLWAGASNSQFDNAPLGRG